MPFWIFNTSLLFQPDSESNLESEDSPHSQPSIQSVVKQEQVLDQNCNENSPNTMTNNNTGPINPLEVESHRRQQDANSLALLSYGMTSGLVGGGVGASVGETELGVWLEHVWFKHVPQSNFLLADSFPVHTAQKTQKLLLEVSEIIVLIRSRRLEYHGLHGVNCYCFA